MAHGDYQVKLITTPLAANNAQRLTQMRQQLATRQCIPGYINCDGSWQKYIRETVGVYLFGFYKGNTLLAYAIMDKDAVIQEFMANASSSNPTNPYMSNYDRFAEAMKFIQNVYLHLRNTAGAVAAVQVSEQKSKLGPQIMQVITVTAVENIISAYNLSVVKLYK